MPSASLPIIAPSLRWQVLLRPSKGKVDNTVQILEEAGRRYWAPCRYRSLYREAITAKDYGQAVPVVVTMLEQLQEHGADAAVWRRLSRTPAGFSTGWQMPWSWLEPRALHARDRT
ncbi:hypothetical protein [Streptomyces cyanogenus]|nr:hypothetical protein [Streptomyces cyanogenus]